MCGEFYPGQAPKDKEEHRIYGMKQGLEFIADRSHTITEENLFRLYQMTIGDFLPAEDRLLPEHWYRHDSVYIVGSKVEHTGLLGRNCRPIWQNWLRLLPRKQHRMI